MQCFFAIEQLVLSEHLISSGFDNNPNTESLASFLFVYDSSQANYSIYEQLDFEIAQTPVCRYHLAPWAELRLFA